MSDEFAAKAQVHAMHRQIELFLLKEDYQQPILFFSTSKGALGIATPTPKKAHMSPVVVIQVAKGPSISTLLEKTDSWQHVVINNIGFHIWRGINLHSIHNQKPDLVAKAVLEGLVAIGADKKNGQKVWFDTGVSLLKLGEPWSEVSIWLAGFQKLPINVLRHLASPFGKDCHNTQYDCVKCIYSIK